MQLTVKDVFSKATLIPTDKQPPEPAEALKVVELSDSQLDISDVEGPIKETGDQLLRPRFKPNIATDWRPVVAIFDTTCEDKSGELNVRPDEINPNSPDTLATTGKDLDAPDGIFCERTESLTQKVANEEVPLKELLCEIAALANFEPAMTLLTDPETGGTKDGRVAGAGAVNEIAFETNELDSKETSNDKLRPKPELALETMEDSETQTWNWPADDSILIFCENDAEPNSLPKSVTNELPDEGTTNAILERAKSVSYEVQIIDADFWRATDAYIRNFPSNPGGALDFKVESDRHSELNELDLWNLEAIVVPWTLNDDPIIVIDNDPDLARFVIVSADIAGTVTDKKFDSIEPALLPTLARIDMDAPAMLWTLHKAEESEIHIDICALLVRNLVIDDEWRLPKPAPWIVMDTAPEAGNCCTSAPLIDALKYDIDLDM